MASQLLLAQSQSLSTEEADRLGAEYETLLTGALLAVAAIRIGYLQEFAAAEGEDLLDIPARAMAPTVQDVLVGGQTDPLPPVRGVGAGVPTMPQEALRAPSNQGAMRAALAQLERDMRDNVPDALPRAQKSIADWTESTAMSAADWTDAMVLRPNGRIAALRRVAHPGACDRCMNCAGVLIFKSSPRPRHPQCHCSFEPVYLTDPEYQKRLASYRSNAAAVGARTGRYARDMRQRGRRQLEEARQRDESVFLQDAWQSFLADEQTRLSKLVKSVSSNTYRQWAVMTSANQAEAVSDLLPVIIRN
jgi:hypothetical protein